MGYQIGRQVRIKGVHRHLIGGISTKADKAVRPHKDCPTFRNAGCGRIERSDRRIDNRNKFVPTGTEDSPPRRPVERYQMVARAAQVGASREARSG